MLNTIAIAFLIYTKLLGNMIKKAEIDSNINGEDKAKTYLFISRLWKSYLEQIIISLILKTPFIFCKIYLFRHQSFIILI